MTGRLLADFTFDSLDGDMTRVRLQSAHWTELMPSKEALFVHVEGLRDGNQEAKPHGKIQSVMIRSRDIDFK